jgi:hypothetical protein
LGAITGKKTAAAVERDAEVKRFLQRAGAERGVDLEIWEFGLRQVVLSADGARYNWEIAALHFQGAVEIVDLYHARQHLHDLVDYLLPQGGREAERLHLQWRTFLDEGRVEKIIAEAERCLPRNGPRRKAARKQINYFVNNARRMRYREFRDQGLFVGSGVVEAGCKTVIGKRLKQSGMEWSARAANAIIALRCLYLSGRCVVCTSPAVMKSFGS